MSARHSDISNDCQTSEINFQSFEIIFDILRTVSMFSTWIDKDEIIISVTDVDATNLKYVLTPWLGILFVSNPSESLTRRVKET